MDLRVLKTDGLIRETFLQLLAEKDFTEISVREITERARINRSTFYRHYEDKYQLRDAVIDRMMAAFTEHLDIHFLVADCMTSEKHIHDLKRCLKYFHQEKERWEVLWNSVMLGRNVFDEMVEVGAGRIQKAILKHPGIRLERKARSDWYAHLLVNNLLVSVRWWFQNDSRVTLDEMTGQIIEHMTYGAVPTLLGKV